METLEPFPIHPRISHNCFRKTFFALANCQFCNGILFQGFRCSACGIRFHGQCFRWVPNLCQPFQMDIYYRHLLALNAEKKKHKYYIPCQANHRCQQNSLLSKQPRRPLSTIPAKDKQGLKADLNSSPINESMTSNKNFNFLLKPNFLTIDSQQRELSISTPNVNANLSDNDSKNKDTIIRSQSNKIEINKEENKLKLKRVVTTCSNSNELPANSNLMTNKIYNSSHFLSSTFISSKNCSKMIEVDKNTDINNRPRARSADEFAKKSQLKETYPDLFEDWEINNDEILVGQKIGSGSYGTVFKGHWHGPVALKRLKVAKPSQAQLDVNHNHTNI